MWDYAIISALQAVEDNTDSNGLLAYETEPEAMDVSAKRKINKFTASVEKRTKGTDKHPYKAEPGETWVPELNWLGKEEDYPTYRSYLEKIRSDAMGETKEEDWGSSHYGMSWEERQALEDEEHVVQ